MFLMKRKYRLELDHKHARVIVDDQTAFLDRYTRARTRLKTGGKAYTPHII